MTTTSSAEEFPYKTYLHILHGPLELIDVKKLVDACIDKWYNQTLCKVNDSVVRMAVVQGEYHWHEHKDIDECFFVLDGRFLIDLEDHVIDLAPRQGFVVPRGVRHRTRAQPGWTYGPFQSGSDRGGYVLARGESRDDALERADRAAQRIRFETVDVEAPAQRA